MSMEPMQDFFATRVPGYDAHMLCNVAGCQEGYRRMAKLLPDHAETLLDLGCGTGLELDYIFQEKPFLAVTGIDITGAMLNKLREKHPDKNLTLVKASYFDYPFGSERFDAAVSFQTLHHFSPAEKTGLYTKIYRALNGSGRYIECDYMVATQNEQDFFQAENKRRRAAHGIAEGELYHYDIPCTAKNQIQMLKAAGFATVSAVWREANTTLLVAEKNRR